MPRRWFRKKHRPYDTKRSELLLENDFFDNFDQMSVEENIIRGIYSYGFEKQPNKQHAIQQAQSGMDKTSTSTFCSGILQQLDYDLAECQALVVAPTKELTQHIEKVMRTLGDCLGVKVHACLDETTVREDQRILSAGVHVVVGTPDRVFDMLRRQSFCPNYFEMFVMNEADGMLSRGFTADEMQKILEF